MSFQLLSERDERKESTCEISSIYFKQTFRSSHISWRFLLTLRRVIKETLISHHSSRQTRESLIGYHIEREKIFLSSNISSQTKPYTYDSNIHNVDWICMSIFLMLKYFEVIGENKGFEHERKFERWEIEFLLFSFNKCRRIGRLHC